MWDSEKDIEADGYRCVSYSFFHAVQESCRRICLFLQEGAISSNSSQKRRYVSLTCINSIRISFSYCLHIERMYFDSFLLGYKYEFLRYPSIPLQKADEASFPYSSSSSLPSQQYVHSLHLSSPMDAIISSRR